MNEYHSFGVSCLVINSHHCLDGWRPFFPWIFIRSSSALNGSEEQVWQMRALRIRVFCLVDCCSQMGFACDDGAFFSAAMQSFFFFSPSLCVSMWKKIYVIEVLISVEFQESFVVQELPKKSDLIMKWTRLLHHAFVLHIVVSQRVKETFGAFCWNLRGCWGVHQNRFFVNFLTHSLPRCFVVYYVIACYTLFELRLQYTSVSGLHNAFSGELYFHQELPFSTFGKDHIKCMWFLALSFVSWKPSSCTDLGNFSPSLICKYCCRGN